MSPHENQAIADLTNEVRGYRKDIAVLHTKLFGDEKSENPKGRIPIIESTLATHGHRLKKVEPIVLVLRGIYAILIAAAGYALDHFFPLRGH